ncbi:MAG: hypothetical protein V2G44_08025 [bacterium JZ-2024 1]
MPMVTVALPLFAHNACTIAVCHLTRLANPSYREAPDYLCSLRHFRKSNENPYG